MAPPNPDYKSITYSQLRSFCETARLGGMAQAAAALDVTPPTVWKQLRSLESHVGLSLVEPHTRGCRLTEAGKRLLEMAGPLIAEVQSLGDRFQAAVGMEKRRLVVAVSPRPCEEELLSCVIEFERRFLDVRLVLLETVDRLGVIERVRAGDADVGVATLTSTQLPEELQTKPLYELEPILLVPHGHPLTKKKIRLEDFAKYPLLNMRHGDFSAELATALDQVGAYENPDRRVELYMSRTIRKYVQHGMGIGIVARPVTGKPATDVIELPLRHIFPYRRTVYAMYRSHVVPDSELCNLVTVIRDILED